jgi:hypothetical protein
VRVSADGMATSVRTAIVAALLLAVNCAGQRAPMPLPLKQYVFLESLPDETRVCVRRDPFLEELACLSLGEVRQIARHLRRASAR